MFSTFFRISVIHLTQWKTDSPVCTKRALELVLCLCSVFVAVNISIIVLYCTLQKQTLIRLSFITRSLHLFLHFPFIYLFFDHKFFNSIHFVTVSLCSDNVSLSVSPTSFTATYPSRRLIHCFLILELG